MKKLLLLLRGIKNTFGSASYKRTLSFLTLLIIVAAIPLTVYLSGQRQDLRQHASEACRFGGMWRAADGSFVINQEGNHINGVFPIEFMNKFTGNQYTGGIDFQADSSNSTRAQGTWAWTNTQIPSPLTRVGRLNMVITNCQLTASIVEDTVLAAGIDPLSTTLYAVKDIPDVTSEPTSTPRPTPTPMVVYGSSSTPTPTPFTCSFGTLIYDEGVPHCISGGELPTPTPTPEPSYGEGDGSNCHDERGACLVEGGQNLQSIGTSDCPSGLACYVDSGESREPTPTRQFDCTGTNYNPQAGDDGANVEYACMAALDGHIFASGWTTDNYYHYNCSNQGVIGYMRVCAYRTGSTQSPAPTPTATATDDGNGGDHTSSGTPQSQACGGTGNITVNNNGGGKDINVTWNLPQSDPANHCNIYLNGPSGDLQIGTQSNSQCVGGANRITLPASSPSGGYNLIISNGGSCNNVTAAHADLTFSTGGTSGGAGATATPAPTRTAGSTGGGTGGECRNNPVQAGDGLTWVADCSSTCSANSQCPANTTDPAHVNPTSSNWCYGFSGANRCMQLRYTRSSTGGSSGGTTTCTAGHQDNPVTDEFVAFAQRQSPTLVQSITGLNPTLLNPCTPKQVISYWCNGGVAGGQAQRDCQQLKDQLAGGGGSVGGTTATPGVSGAVPTLTPQTGLPHDTATTRALTSCGTISGANIGVAQCTALPAGVDRNNCEAQLVAKVRQQCGVVQ